MISIYVCIYMYRCHFFMYILICNRAPWKNSLTEWSTLYNFFLKKSPFGIVQPLESIEFQDNMRAYAFDSHGLPKNAVPVGEC